MIVKTKIGDIEISESGIEIYVFIRKKSQKFTTEDSEQLFFEFCFCDLTLKLQKIISYDGVICKDFLIWGDTRFGSCFGAVNME